MSDHAREEHTQPPPPAERGEARPPDRIEAVRDTVYELWQRLEPEARSAGAFRKVHAAIDALAAPAAQPETDCAICRLQGSVIGHWAWHRFCQGELNPVAFVLSLGCFEQTPEVKRIAAHVVAITGMDVEGARAAMKGECAEVEAKHKLAAPAAPPETAETAWQTRAEAAEAELALLREALRRETLIVDNVWGALGISTYAEARGKHIAELVSELRIELASLKAELPAPAAPPEKD